MKEFYKKYKTHIFAGLAILMTILLCTSISANLNNKKIYKNNIKALTDTVHVYKTKNGDLVAEKTVLLGDYKILKDVNEDLYNQVNELKSKPDHVVYVNTETVNVIHDTTYIVKDNEVNYLKRDFDFSNEWRTLSGTIEFDRPNLNLNIDKDYMKTDFTIVVKDSKVYVTSNNPYMQYNDIQGVILPKRKPKFSINVGPSVGVGYDVINKNPGVYFGVNITAGYNLFTF